MTTPGFAALVEGWFDGTLTAEEQSEMEAELLRSTTARDYFWEVGSLHGHMRVAAKLELGCTALLSETVSGGGTAPASESVVQPTNFAAPVPDEESQRPLLPSSEYPDRPVLGFLGSAFHLAGSWLSSPKILALTIVGCLGTYFLGLMISIAISRAFLTDRQAQERAESQSGAPARIISASGCRWQDRAPRADLGGNLPAGTSRLAEGIVELEFDGGARVRIEGPAEFAAQSGQHIQLVRGRLTAYVPRRARGFTVDTPTAEVVDLGTEFAVAVEADGQTEVHVVRGLVDVKQSAPGDSTGSSGEVRLSAGSAIRVTRGQSASRIPFDAEKFKVPHAANPPLARGHERAGSTVEQSIEELPAGAIYVANASFASPDVGRDHGGVPTFWTAGGLNRHFATILSSTYANVKSGVQAVSAGQQSHIYQNVGALQANMLYTLTVDVVSRVDSDSAGGIGAITLYNGTSDTDGTVLATNSGNFGLARNAPAITESVQFVTGANPSGDLTIILANTSPYDQSYQVLYTNVRLTAVAVTEPEAQIKSGDSKPKDRQPALSRPPEN